MNGFAMIFGQCVWSPPSEKVALAALMLFYGIGVHGQPDVEAYDMAIAEQYVEAGKTSDEASKQVVHLEECFATYEVASNKRHVER